MSKQVDCCIAGGGPAGMMLGVLLARVGLRILVLEKHKDFLRDFRGDTIHPSTMEIMHELGWLEEFLKLPHEPVRQLVGQFGDDRIKLADFSHLSAQAKFIAMMPQWDFLDFLARKGANYPSFELWMNAEVTGFAKDGASGPANTLAVRTPDSRVTVTAPLVVAADGRVSTLRAAAGLKPTEFGAPMDVLWFRLSRQPNDTAETQARFESGRIFIMLNRGDYWQCAFVIAKGHNEQIRAQGLDAFRRGVASLVPFESARVSQLASWELIKLLTVKVDRLDCWHAPGLLCIGDAAHAMSPVGGVGINLAVQDAVAAANILARPLLQRRLSTGDLQAVQRRREWPTRVTQRLQLTMQNAIIAPTLSASSSPRPPTLLRWITRLPMFNRVLPRVFGLGVQPEHVSEFIRRGHSAPPFNAPA